MQSVSAWICVLMLGLASVSSAQAQDESEDAAESQDDASAAEVADEGKQAAPDAVAAPVTAAPAWWFGAYLEGAWVPSFMLKLFLAEAPTVGNVGFGVTATHRNKDGMSILIGLGYTGYGFDGPFRLKGDPEQDTEYVESTLGFLHLRGELLWSTPIVKDTLTFEYGVGLDVGVVLGEMKRTEAFRENGVGAFRPCVAPLNPPVLAGAAGPYCELPVTPGAGTDAYNQDGAHYHVVEKRIPPVMLIPMLPVLALRYTPIPELAIKLHGAFGLLQFAVGISAEYGLNI
jgi:hypothetical protein